MYYQFSGFFKNKIIIWHPIAEPENALHYTVCPYSLPFAIVKECLEYIIEVFSNEKMEPI
jgi:hypothetical protein